MFQNKTISELYPQFANLHFNLNGFEASILNPKVINKTLVEIEISNNKSKSVSPESYMNPENNLRMKIKFLENDYNKFQVKVSIN